MGTSHQPPEPSQAATVFKIKIKRDVIAEPSRAKTAAFQVKSLSGLVTRATSAKSYGIGRSSKRWKRHDKTRQDQEDSK